MNESTKTFLPMRFDNQKINEGNPWEDDVLERYKFADILTDKVKNGVSPYTISVNGGWGAGKTFMLQRWRQQLENDGYKAIYYNAWEDDFCVNPLVSIIGQISTEIKDDSFKSLIDNVKKFANSLFYDKTIKLSLFQKIITSSWIKNIPKSFVEKQLQEYGINIIDEYSKQTAQTKKLKEKLEELTKKIEKETRHPLIFIIDELDRCRPTFAIEILERIKHLFNIPGIIFVLGMNRKELEKSIKHVYGNINSEEYLRRFYDIDLTLSAPKSSDYCHHLVHIETNALSDLATANGYTSYAHISTQSYPYLFDYLNLSLRDIEHCFRMLCSIVSTKNLSSDEGGWAAISLVVLKIKNHELYLRFIQGKSSSKEVVNYICELIPGIDERTTELVNGIVKGIYAVASDAEWNDITQAAEDYYNNGSSAPELDKRVLLDIRQFGANYFNERCGNDTLQKIVDSLR